jgi:lysophospholipase L1-like esterase
MIPIDKAKTILCFGDSNTWGNVPRSDERYPRGVRWPSKLQELLGDEYEVISEGLCGRTLVVVDPKKPHRSGISYLQACLESHDPIDLMIIMLGSNDVKTTFNLEAKDIAVHLEQVIRLVRDKNMELTKQPKILVICPPSVIIPHTKDLDGRMVRGPEIFKILPTLYKDVAKRTDCFFMNAGDYISSSLVDGYHLDADAHIKLAEIIKEHVEKIMA